MSVGWVEARNPTTSPINLWMLGVTTALLGALSCLSATQPTAALNFLGVIYLADAAIWLN